MDNIWDYFVFTGNFSDLRNVRGDTFIGITTHTAEGTFTLDITPRRNVEFNDVTIEMQGHVGTWEWSFGEWVSGELEHTELHRFIQIPFDGRTSISATIFGFSMINELSLPLHEGGPRPVSVSGTVTYR